MTDRNPCTVPWLEPLADALARDRQAVLAVIASVQGSAPREPGTAMVISREGCHGSIGGGHLEFEVLRIARDALAADASNGAWIVRFPLAARLGQCCGGVATLAFAKIERRASAWLEAALTCARTGESFALVTRIAQATADPGTMLVTPDDTRGSLGSRELDSSAIALARTRLAGVAQGAALVRFAEDDTTTLLVQIERPDPFPVLVFGNGHVGRALVGVLGVVPAQVRWIDSRADDFPEHVARNVEIVITETPEDEIEHAPAGAFVVVTTHSHALDLALIETALTRDDWRYIGLIGSTSKRAQFERRLVARGIAPEAFARVHCPIGARGVAIKGKHPGAIAIAIAAELLVVREASARSPVLRMAVR
jgi:xanthine dehydrogenase accessory factor